MLLHPNNSRRPALEFQNNCKQNQSFFLSTDRGRYPENRMNTRRLAVENFARSIPCNSNWGLVGEWYLIRQRDCSVIQQSGNHRI